MILIDGQRELQSVCWQVGSPSPLDMLWISSSYPRLALRIIVPSLTKNIWLCLWRLAFLLLEYEHYCCQLNQKYLTVLDSLLGYIVVVVVAE